MKLRFLKWCRDGYHPEGYDWSNYRNWTTNNVLLHDLYHHQLNESGTEEEELRALGAFAYLERDDTIRYNLKFRFSISLHDKAQAYRSEGQWKHGSFILNHVMRLAKLGVISQPEYYLDKLSEGWEHAKTHDRQGYARFKHIDFEVLHRQGLDVTVDLDKGSIVETKESEEAEQEKLALEQSTRMLRDFFVKNDIKIDWDKVSK